MPFFNSNAVEVMSFCWLFWYIWHLPWVKSTVLFLQQVDIVVKLNGLRFLSYINTLLIMDINHFIWMLIRILILNHALLTLILMHDFQFICRYYTVSLISIKFFLSLGFPLSFMLSFEFLSHLICWQSFDKFDLLSRLFEFVSLGLNKWFLWSFFFNI